MHEKQGRERKFNFRDEEGFAEPDAQWMFGMWLELGERVYDQIEHVPAATLNLKPNGSYLSPARVVLHLIGSDLRSFKTMAGQFPQAGYHSLVEKTTSTDFETMQTEQIDVLGILKQHLVFRKNELLSRCHEPGFLDKPVDHPSFAINRDLLGHQIWHWSFHSGHIGAATLELGYEYHWTSSKRQGK